MKFDLVAFDFDGTLADTIPLLFDLIPELTVRHGLQPVSEEAMEQFRSEPHPNVAKVLNIPPWKMPFIVRDVRRMARERVSQMRLFLGIPEVLQHLHDCGIKLAVVSSNGEETVRAVLGEALAPLFVEFVCGVSLQGKRTRLRRLAARLGVPPARALYLGDESRDEVAALAAGYTFGGVLWGYSRRSAFVGGERVFLVENPEMLCNLCGGG